MFVHVRRPSAHRKRWSQALARLAVAVTLVATTLVAVVPPTMQAQA